MNYNLIPIPPKAFEPHLSFSKVVIKFRFSHIRVRAVNDYFWGSKDLVCVMQKAKAGEEGKYLAAHYFVASTAAVIVIIGLLSIMCIIVPRR